MFITKKMLKATGLSKLCLVIHLDDGIKVQYPVLNEAEAIAKYTEFLQHNQNVRIANDSDFFAAYDTISDANFYGADLCVSH